MNKRKSEEMYFTKNIELFLEKLTNHLVPDCTIQWNYSLLFSSRGIIFSKHIQFSSITQSYPTLQPH